MEINNTEGGIATDGAELLDSSIEPIQEPQEKSGTELDTLKNQIAQLSEQNQKLFNQISQFAQQQPIVQPNTQPQSNEDYPKPGNIENVDQLLEYNKKVADYVAKKSVQEAMTPLMTKLAQQTLEQNVNSFFMQNPEANNLKTEINGYYSQLPAQRKNYIAQSLANGDTSVLNEMYAAVALKNKNTTSQQINTQIEHETKMSSGTAGYRQPSRIDTKNTIFEEAKKTGNYRPIFDKLAAQQYGF
jgi:hypothetical protein